MITLTMERLDHAVVLKLPTEHEHVMVALWRLGLNRDPHMYTLGELNAVFSYDTPEEHPGIQSGTCKGTHGWHYADSSGIHGYGRWVCAYGL